MSKGLEALGKITGTQNLTMYEQNECLKTIEEELKDYEMEHTLRVRLENINYELVREKQENENKLKALEIIKKHLSIVVPINDVIEIFDIDLWNDGKQKEEFEFVRKVLEL